MRPSVSLSVVRTLAIAFACTAVSSARASAQQGGSILDKMDQGPITGRLGLEAALEVPSYCRFADSKVTKEFLVASENPPSGNEVGLLFCQTPGSDSSGYWFVVFSFDKSGYVKDTEKQTLDGAKILKTIQAGTEAGNEARRDQGWDELFVDGWERPPYYDTLTHNLTWSTRLHAKGSPDQTVNHSVRLLGRRGVMHADLVADPADMAVAVPAFDSILVEYSYLAGHSYSEWKEGDKIAKYGLTALIAGGTGAAAMKLGLFGKMWKFILGMIIALKKALIAIVVAIGAFFKRFFGKKEPKEEPPPPSTPPVRPPSGAYKPVSAKPSAAAAPTAARSVQAPASASLDSATLK